jgi:hypothetical protein
MFKAHTRSGQIWQPHSRHGVTAVAGFYKWGNILVLAAVPIANLGWQLLSTALMPSLKQSNCWSLEFLYLALQVNLAHIFSLWARFKSIDLTRSIA